MDYREHIVRHPHVRSGRPIIRGTWITIGDIFAWLTDGMTEEEILAEHPVLSAADMRAVFAFMMDPERSAESELPPC